MSKHTPKPWIRLLKACRDARDFCKVMENHAPSPFNVGTPLQKLEAAIVEVESAYPSWRSVAEVEFPKLEGKEEVRCYNCREQYQAVTKDIEDPGGMVECPVCGSFSYHRLKE